MEWGLIGTLIGIGLLFTFLLRALGWAAWISLLIMLVISGCVGIWNVQSYPQRQEDYQKQNREHQASLLEVF